MQINRGHSNSGFIDDRHTARRYSNYVHCHSLVANGVTMVPVLCMHSCERAFNPHVLDILVTCKFSNIL